MDDGDGEGLAGASKGGRPGEVFCELQSEVGPEVGDDGGADDKGEAEGNASKLKAIHYAIELVARGDLTEFVAFVLLRGDGEEEEEGSC